jgi:alkylation response protein AidB-like acyl-CoA dehydrogenase
MCIIPASDGLLQIDVSEWHPLGMEASVSGRVTFDGIEVGDAALLGAPGDYLRDPWFRGGAIRFCAVQLGGAESLLQIAVEHLRRVGRAGDLMQIERIGQCAIAVEGGRAWLARSARVFDKGFERNGRPHVAEIVLEADMTRMAIERICLDVMEVTTRSVGVAGLLRPHPLELTLRDLMTYLRQPAPDAALISVGRAILACDKERAAE